MKRLVFLLGIGLSILGYAFDAPPNSKAVLEYVDHKLPSYGVLKNNEGFVYVDVNDDYIHALIPYLLDEGYIEPSYFGPGRVGAHISVIYPEEIKLYGIEDIEENLEVISFNIKECQIVHPVNKNESAYFLLVESYRLDEIRQNYGLPKRDHSFHILIGVKPNSNSSCD